MGQPMMYVVDANYLNRGELFLANKWNGLEVDAAKAMPTLQNLTALWGRPVHRQARVQEEMRLFTCQLPDAEVTSEKITEDTPAPAHIVA